MKPEDRKNIVSALFLSTLIVLLGTVFCGGASEERPSRRKFRPMKMARVKVTKPSAQVDLSNSGFAPETITPSVEHGAAAGPHVSDDAVKAREMGWADFEIQKWNSARDWFITALEWDPSSVDAAKGLVMSIYYGGATGDAYQLGRELGAAMPELRDVVPDAVRGEVRMMMKSSKWEDAEKLLKQFPSTDPQFMSIAEEVEKAVEGKAGKMTSADQSSGSNVSSVVEFVRKNPVCD